MGFNSGFKGLICSNHSCHDRYILKQGEHATCGRSPMSLLAFKLSVPLPSLAFAELLAWRYMTDVRAQKVLLIVVFFRERKKVLQGQLPDIMQEYSLFY